MISTLQRPGKAIGKVVSWTDFWQCSRTFLIMIMKMMMMMMHMIMLMMMMVMINDDVFRPLP